MAAFTIEHFTAGAPASGDCPPGTALAWAA